ncbi:MAG: hypothetical protein IT515_04035 [Burkholderiales bacterium]|nr:hypothetical protein [Burkholderiales bacterium]
MRRRAAIDSSLQLCLWDELDRTADEQESAASPPAVRTGQEPLAADRWPTHPPEALGKATR